MSAPERVGPDGLLEPYETPRWFPAVIAIAAVVAVALALIVLT